MQFLKENSWIGDFCQKEWDSLNSDRQESVIIFFVEQAAHHLLSKEQTIAMYQYYLNLKIDFYGTV